ncbi:Vacuolar protein-sorting-associated protein 28 [Sorochytrium milnesiophthora]
MAEAPPPRYSYPQPLPALPDEEIRLFASASEREHYDNLSDLYGIILSTEYLEKAYIRDAITPATYTPICSKLIAQFKTALNAVRYSVSDVERFMQEYRLSCPLAVNRLLRIGVPATVEHSSGSHDPHKSAQYVAEAVQHFITLMDSLKLNMVAVDQLHPLLSDLISALNNVPTLPVGYQGKEKIKNWLIELNKMKASDEITDDQVRQLLFDLESAHSEFYRSLGRN